MLEKLSEFLKDKKEFPMTIEEVQKIVARAVLDIQVTGKPSTEEDEVHIAILEIMLNLCVSHETLRVQVTADKDELKRLQELNLDKMWSN